MSWLKGCFFVSALFVNDVDIFLTCSLGIQVFLRPREMGRESECVCVWGASITYSLTPGRPSASTGWDSVPSTSPPLSQFSTFSGYWKPQEIRLETPDPPGFPDPHLGPTASNPSRWPNKRVEREREREREPAWG